MRTAARLLPLHQRPSFTHGWKNVSIFLLSRVPYDNETKQNLKFATRFDFIIFWFATICNKLKIKEFH